MIFLKVLNVTTEVRVEQGWKFFCMLSPLGQIKCLSCIRSVDAYLHKASICD
jgi:hypothetical protein